jgi:hypothetical protein
VHQALPAVDAVPASLLERSLALVCERSPVIKRAIDHYGELSLADYLRQTLVVSDNPLQPRDDLLEAVYRYAAPLLGDTVAERAAQELKTLPAVLTANHHGVDFLAQSLSSSLIFSLREVGGKPATTVPVFACGNVPLDNPTYPKGLLLYHADWRAPNRGLPPLKLPVFSNRHRRKPVSMVAAYDSDMLVQAERRLAAMVCTGQIPATLAKAVENILSEDYRSGDAKKRTSYSQQAVVLNHRIWRRLFRDPERAPDMVYLELEKITGHLLQRDLRDEDSLVWQIMFNPTLRAEVLRRLDGARACWDRGKLTRRAYPKPSDRQADIGGCGTIFFWAINDKGCRVPLSLMNSASQTPMLQGRDDGGGLWTVPFEPQCLLQNLNTGHLLPSLFTCFVTIGFARGISCYGGYFQAGYLARMQDGLANILLDIEGYKEYGTHLTQVPSNSYLSGMQVVLNHYESEFLLPAGPVEIIATGGLSQSQLLRMHSTTVRDAHLAGLMETIPDFQPKGDLPHNWYWLLAEESTKIQRGRSLII